MTKSRKPLSFTELLRSTLAIVVFFLMLLIMTPVILILLIISLGKLSNFVVEKIAPLIVKPVFPVAGIDFRIRKYTDEIHYPAVYIINHSSTLDILTILALGLPKVRFVAKWQLQYNPLFFILGRITGQVFIRRERSERAIEVLNRNVSRIKEQGLTVMLAPEGSRKHPGVIGPFKKGPFRMAMDLNYPIVPIYFEGNRKLSQGGFLLTRSGKITAHIHPPIDTSDWTLDNLDVKMDRVRNLYLGWAEVSNRQSVTQ